MYQELIDKIKPLPRFNTGWNKGVDEYSDGNVEDVLVNLIAENDTDDYSGIIANNFSWPVFYHLTDFRANILNWYPFSTDASVLEIGCGFGAITSTLCEKCKRVTAVELSERRATGTLLRCRNYDNLEIIVGNLNDIEFEEKYDYITLIGVLEYQGKYTKTKNPYVDFLKTVKSLLKPDGKLLIAIENQFGIKYWCGIKEDHTGIPFDGMNNYLLSDCGIRTFSRDKLKSIINEAGFANSFFYYPMPDYKLPTVIYSEEYIPAHIDGLEIIPYSSNGTNTLVATEHKLYQELIDNNVFEFFSNSFLVECTDCEEVGEVVFAKCNTVRSAEYQIGTKIYRDKRVEKFSLKSANAIGALRGIIKNSSDLKNRGIDVAGCELSDKMTVFSSYIDGISLNKLLDEYANTGNREAIFDVMNSIFADIEKSSDVAADDMNLMYSLDGLFEKKDYGDILKIGYLDMISRNALMCDGKICWIDQEWILENVPLRYVMYRNIKTLYEDCCQLNECIPIVEMYERYGISDIKDDFEKFDNVFLSSVINELTVAEMGYYTNIGLSDCVKNIKKLITEV